MIKFVKSPEELERLRAVLDSFYVQHRQEDSHDHHLESYSEYMDLVEEYAHPKSKILEIGSGTAVVANALAERGYEVHAVDCYSDNKINELSEKFQQPRLKLHGGGILSFHEKKDTFDLVCSRCTFEHLLDLEDVLTKAVHILKPGGIFAVTGPNYDSFGLSFKGMKMLLSYGGRKKFSCYQDIGSVLQGFFRGWRNVILGAFSSFTRPFKYFWPHMVNGALKFERADDDAVCWVSSINLQTFLIERRFKILSYNQYPATTLGRFIYQFIPHMASHYRIIARKEESV